MANDCPKNLRFEIRCQCERMFERMERQLSNISESTRWASVYKCCVNVSTTSQHTYAVNNKTTYIRGTLAKHMIAVIEKRNNMRMRMLRKC